MKKTLLLGTALVVGVAGFAQNASKKAVNPKYLQKTSIFSEGRVSVEPKPTTATGIKVAKKGHNTTLASCTNQNEITTSWNCFGVGGGGNTPEQNCLSYNKDLNVLVWTQRGSKTWALNTTSGCLQGTVINPASGAAIDSVILYKDGGTNHARYPGGAWLNPAGNTDYHKAFACASGYTTPAAGGWNGTAYTAKPMWSQSAVNHTAPTADSLWSAANSAPFGPIVASTNFCGAAQSDMQQVGNAVWSCGTYMDASVTDANGIASRKGFIAKGTITGNTVTWTVDSTSLAPVARKTPNLGYIIDGPRLAMGPDGMHGYAVFIGRLDQDYGNKSDSAKTPIVFKTTDAGATWTQVLAGYDWVCKHPEALRNVGLLTGKTSNYSFNGGQGSDLTVDANNVLHYVTTVSQPFHGTDIDSLGVYTYSYDFDNANHHEIIWDFMTDGTDWKTMMVDSILSANCSSSTTDTTSSHSAMGGTSILGVGAHITVSRSTDGTKVFYGWADSDPNVLGVNATGATYNTNPDILMKAYDVNGMVSATKNVTGGLGTCFFPFLADQSYSDGAGGWVVPAVYTVGDVIIAPTPQVTYDASSQADYFYTNCGSFVAADYTATAPVNNALTGPCFIGIKTNNTFESSVSNYPNPFNGTTTIAVTLSENKAFNVNVYNAIGTLVYSKKVNGNVGENAVSFDGSALSAGVYYYTVTAGNQQATKKMIIQK
jgi:hypothetical protein